MHTMVEAGQRLVIFGGVHECGALHDLLFLENAAGKKTLISNMSCYIGLRDTYDENEENFVHIMMILPKCFVETLF